MQDGAFAGQDVVADAEALHRGQVGPDDAPGDVPGQGVLGVPAVLDPLVDLGLAGLGFGVVGEVGGDAGVEVPAVVVELAGQGLEVGDRLLLELHEPEDDVDDLDAGVVDVVLDLDRLSFISETAGQGVAEAGVPQVADVGGLVGIDVGVLDDDLPLFGGEGGPAGRADGLGEDRGLVEPEVEETGAGDLGFDDAFDRGQQGSGLRCDGPGRFSELLGQLEGEGQGQVAHLRVGRRGHVEVGELDRIDGLQLLVDRRFQPGFVGDHFRRPIITNRSRMEDKHAAEPAGGFWLGRQTAQRRLQLRPMNMDIEPKSIPAQIFLWFIFATPFYYRSLKTYLQGGKTALRALERTSEM